MLKRISKFNSGYLLIQVLVFGSVGVIIIGGLIGWAGTSLRYSNYLASREQALAIAESGLDYYRWHLAHAPQDFQDGTDEEGPYTHSFEDKNGDVIGQFSLTIIPPVVGSTIVTVQSKGEIFDGSGAIRTLESKLAVPSLAKYAMVANADMRFGEGTEVFGPIHSNGGVRFDGLAHNLVTSARSTYDDPDHNGGLEYGVHTHLPLVDPLPPNTLPARTDVFATGRQFPVPAVDFIGLSADLADIKAEANTAEGLYLTGSGSQGYHLVLKVNNTVDVYKVTSIYSPDKGCDNPGQEGWGTWSIRRESFITNYPFPINGLIFVEDNLWVSGKIDQARLTIASARFPESTNTNTSITINEDLEYTNFDGQDVLSLVAQNNVNVGQYSEDDLIIHGALVAKSGRVGRYYYETGCDYHDRYRISLFGMIATKERYGFAYTDNTGYDIRNIVYDGNLLYGPPPSFPLTSEQYQTISWREI
jgi:hypothetical protein